MGLRTNLVPAGLFALRQGCNSFSACALSRSSDIHLLQANFMTQVPKVRDPNELMTTGDVSKLLGLTSQYVQAMSREGKLPVAVTTAGGIRLFRRADIEQLAEQRRKNPPRRGPPPGTGGRPPKQVKKAQRSKTKA